MLVGVLSDAHGNAAGLALCLRVLQKLGADKVLYLGDALGYFPHARAVCSLLMQADALCLMGNHEACFLGYLPATEEQQSIMRHNLCKHIPSKWLHQVERTGPSYAFFAGAKRVLCVHATPQNPLEGRHLSFLHATKNADFVFAGHTHRAAMGQSVQSKQRDMTYYVNVGSCGYPRDHGTLLSVATFDTERNTTTLWRIPFTFSPKVLQKVHPHVLATTQRVSPLFTGSIWAEHA